jgi:uncharacterized protein (DUF305 family)
MEFSVSVALRAVAGSCLPALLLVVAACDPGASPAAPVVVTSSAAPGSPGFFGGTDMAWVEITIAMDEELLPLLDLAATRSSDPRVQALAATVKAGHEQELGVLRSLHDQAKLPAENPHEGMPMPGMVTPDQVTEAAAARGAAFDKLLLRHLEAHLQQGVKLAESERKAGVEPQTRSLAGQVITNRTQVLKDMAES